MESTDESKGELKSNDHVESQDVKQTDAKEITEAAQNPLVETTDKPVEKPPPTIEESCQNMVEKIADYLNGELAATSEDYKLIENLNKLTITKYDDMSATTNALTAKMQEINDKYKTLQPYLTQIDLLEESVLKLEQTAYKLDDYSKKLEAKFKALDKR